MRLYYYNKVEACGGGVVIAAVGDCDDDVVGIYNDDDADYERMHAVQQPLLLHYYYLRPNYFDLSSV